jgi:hypothetical protein
MLVIFGLARQAWFSLGCRRRHSENPVKCLWILSGQFVEAIEKTKKIT